MPRPVRSLLFSTLYPSSVRPGHGIFVETRLRELLTSGAVEARVVAPVPWFPSTDARFGEYALMATTPRRENHHGIDVLHPRYLLPPRVGMNIAPIALALGAIPALRALIREGFDFDLIDAHYYYPDGVAAALLARHFGKPFVVTARGTDVNLFPQFALPRRFIRWAAAHARKSITVSAALSERLRDLGVAPRSLQVLRNGVDLQRFQPMAPAAARSALGWSAEPRLLSVGNLVENKGHHIAIEVIAQLPEFRLTIVGDGPERASLQALADRLGVGARVEFAGRVAQDRLPTYYSAADILILASSREGWPNVLLEAMACGTPVLATAVGGIPEVVCSPAAGRLVGSRTAVEFASGLQEMWAALPARQDVRRHAEGFDWAATTNAQVELFREIVFGAAPLAGSAIDGPMRKAALEKTEHA